MSDQYLLGFELLDRQLIDSANRPCGKVDDLLLEYLPGDDPRSSGPVVTALLSNPGALGPRLPRILSTWVVSIWRRLHPSESPSPIALPWSIIAKIDYAIHLTAHAEEAGLTQSEDWVRDKLIDRIPGSG